jgi:hypothetical protein
MSEREQHNNTINIRNRKLFGVLPVIHFIGLIIGGIGGYMYYYFIGCQSGSCAITSNPWMSILWGIAIGYLVSDLFYKKQSEPESGD